VTNSQQPELRSPDESVPPPPRRRKRTVKEKTGPVPEDNQPGHQPEVVQDKPTGPPPKPTRIAKEHRFAFSFEPLMIAASFAVGVTPWTSGVVVDSDGLRVRFGPWRLETELDNIEGAEVSGPYQVVKVLGPPRLSLADRGITFATNRRAGVCVRFREPVPAMDPLGKLRHPAATLTVEDPEALATLLDP
jgi:hypothetical protein